MKHISINLSYFDKRVSLLFLACQVGETKEIQCNTCTCEENIGWVCTKKGCITKPISKRGKTT